jgi:hypothetical protein
VAEQVQIEGMLEAPEATTWQYGTHLVEQDGVRYALSSDDVDLNQYNGQQVSVTREKVEGYPLNEGDPELVRVSEVQAV